MIHNRLHALDVLRGGTIAGMILVNAVGVLPAAYRQLTHAHWVGLTVADLGLPFFLVIVGITTELTIGRRRAVGERDAGIVRLALRRGLLLFLIGLAGAALVGDDLAQLRIPGVLQRIAVSYLLAVFVALRTGARTRLATAFMLLFGYWLVLTLIPVPANPFGPPAIARPETTLAAWIDRELLGSHLSPETRTWDPEGILSTIPAVATVLMGTVIGKWLLRPIPAVDRVAALLAAGVLATTAGIVWGWSFPVMKGLWTSSFALVTAGAAALALGTLLWIIDLRGWSRWTPPFAAFGVNPLALYVGSVLLQGAMGLRVMPSASGSVSARQVVYDAAFSSWLDPKPASLAFGFTYVLLWQAIASWMHRRGIRIRV